MTASNSIVVVRQGDASWQEAAVGWIDLTERNPWLVLRDVRNELISAVATRREYGVAIDAKRWVVDPEATAALLIELARNRGVAPLPAVSTLKRRVMQVVE
ncbi:hypothetical protein M0638_09365 [Roseomonas sp. NAR14]|uniref:Uncharacterized protein n=1 Tax=Roseomonas acroporae TaxID=2937791 RepID=A0A9X2BW06_9PROT|nr:hypothetical protein [Roseomonas acroporae]MCK8784589.1 hypothetical protein [Roseomonas acroporae]